MRAIAIMPPGMFLSQPPTTSTPSMHCPLTLVSIASAITSRDTSEYFIPSVPMPMPSVTVGDKWFVASTAKSQALDLAAAAEAAAGERKGAWLELDFDTLRKFTGDWLELLEKDGEKALGGPEKFAEFKEQLPRIKKGLEAFEEFDQLNFNSRREGGKLRTTLHFKVR